MLPKEAIEEFKEMYRREYGVDLTDEEASFRANNLSQLYKAVLFPSETAKNLYGKENQ